MEKINDINVFVERLHACVTWGDSYNLFSETDDALLNRFVAAGEEAKNLGFQLTMRDEFFLDTASFRAKSNNEDKDRRPAAS